MCGIVAYSPTLYRMFCAATGYSGTTQRVLSDSATISPQTVTVEFDSNVAPGLPWRFEPLQRNVTVHLGEQELVFFTAENTGNETMVGHATFTGGDDNPLDLQIRWSWLEQSVSSAAAPPRPRCGHLANRSCAPNETASHTMRLSTASPRAT